LISIALLIAVLTVYADVNYVYKYFLTIYFVHTICEQVSRACLERCIAVEGKAESAQRMDLNEWLRLISKPELGTFMPPRSTSFLPAAGTVEGVLQPVVAAVGSVPRALSSVVSALQRSVASRVHARNARTVGCGRSEEGRYGDAGTTATAVFVRAMHHTGRGDTESGSMAVVEKRVVLTTAGGASDASTAACATAAGGGGGVETSPSTVKQDKIEHDTPGGCSSSPTLSLAQSQSQSQSHTQKAPSHVHALREVVNTAKLMAQRGVEEGSTAVSSAGARLGRALQATTSNWNVSKKDDFRIRRRAPEYTNVQNRRLALMGLHAARQVRSSAFGSVYRSLLLGPPTGIPPNPTTGTGQQQGELGAL
jgi:hypothetical protein